MHLNSHGKTPGYLLLLSSQTFLVMKLVAIFLTIGCLQLSAKGFSQSITFAGKDMPLEKVLNIISEQSGYYIFYKYNELKEAKPVTIRLKNQTLKQALQESLKGQKLQYNIENQTIVISQKEEEDESQPKILQVNIKGRITDERGDPLPGATVRVKGSSIAAVSDVNGDFVLRNIESNAVLVISYTGFAQQEISVNGRSEIIIKLKEDLQNLNEIIVVGFGTQKKVNLTGSVSQISSEDLENRPVTSLSSSLQGLLPGLTAVSASAFPGASNASLRIRGIGTTNNSNPFILIDGIPGDMNYLNPDDIENVSVLKDAASAAIYGSRAANGVILITTKKGKLNQKPTITYNGYYGTQRPTALPKMLGSVEYMQMLNEAQRNVNLPPTFTDDQIEVARNGSDPNYFANTNWPKELIRDHAPQQNHNVSINGGSSDFNYYFSYGRQDQEGLVVGDQYYSKRNNARLRLGTNNLFDLIDVDANISYVDRKQNQPAGGTDGDSGPIYTTLTMSPLNPVRFTNGTWGYGGGSSNPLAIASDGGYNNFTSQEFTGNISATLHLLKNLSLKSQYGVNISNQLRSTYSKKIDYFYPETADFWYSNRTSNQLENRDYKIRLENLSAHLDYQLSLGNHNIKTLLGYQQEVYRYDSWYASKTNFVSDEVPVFNLGSANPLATGDGYQYALRSYFGRVNYDFSEKYLLELNLRYDGSSRYAPGNRYGAFPSASAGWRFTKEPFFQKASLSWLTEGKLRASYGSLGNQYGADGVAYSEWYPYINILTGVATMPIGNTLTTGIAQTILSNPGLRWEKVNVFDIGVDLSFLRGRLSLTGDWFDKRTKDIQLKVPQPDILGLTVPDQNAGVVSNKGWEVNVGWNDKIKDFRYGLSAWLSDVKNKVINLGGVPPTIANNITMVGYPIGAFYGYKTDGLAQESDFTTDATTGKLVPTFSIFDADAGKVGPGDIKYRDLNNDGKISADLDRTVIGDDFPRYSYSFRGDLGYKNFDLSFFIQGVGKGNGYISGVGIHAFHANGAFPQEIHRDHWTPENTDAWYPRFTYLDTRNSSARLSDYWLQDASYLRLKNIQLGYTVPARLSNKLRIERLKAYVSADNLFTRTDFFYAYDPETSTTSGGAYPQVKTIVFGINLSLK